MDCKVPSNPLTISRNEFRSESKSEFREIDFGIFVEQFKDVWTSLVSSHEIFASDLYLLLIIRSHSSFLPYTPWTEPRRAAQGNLSQKEPTDDIPLLLP